MPTGRSLGIGVGLVLVAGGVAAIALWPSEPEPESAPVVQPPSTPEPAVADGGVTDGGAVGDAQDEAAEAGGAEDAQDGKANRGTAYMITSLRTAKAFRARARAAIVLGRRGSGRATRALIGALRDRHPAVRVAAVESLRRIGTSRALAALRKHEARESDAKVKRAIQSALAKAPAQVKGKRVAARAAEPPPDAPPEPVRSAPQYYVGVSKLADPKGALGAPQAGKLGAMLRGRVGRLGGVRLAPSGESAAGAKRALAGGATGYYLTASVTRMEYAPGIGMRAGVSLMVGTYPGRNMRAIVKGSVTLPGAKDTAKSREDAMKAAISSAVRKLPSTFARSRR